MEQITWKNFEKVELRAGSEVLTTGFYLPAGEVVLLHSKRRLPDGAKLG
jgi:hypothetical protein